MSDTRNPSSSKTEPESKLPEVQGEGDYEAARRFRKAEENFVKSGQVDEAARRAEPKTQKEADELKRAEREGRSPAKR